ncbi:MAG TPA: hypothetical protein VJN02_03195 [Gammaproteobacteria bacterium]|nr:hypothetical protein [Gammaproteobacteria bacterium]
MNKYIVVIKENGHVKSFPLEADGYKINGFLVEFYDGEDLIVAYNQSKIEQIRLARDE